MKNQLTVS